MQSMIYSPTFSHGELYARNMSRVLAEEQYDERIKSRIMLLIFPPWSTEEDHKRHNNGGAGGMECLCVWKIIIIQGIKIGKTRRKRVKIRSPCCLLAVFVRPPAAGLGGDVVGHVDGGGHELVPRLRGVVVVVVLAAGEAEPRALYMLAPGTRHTTSVLGLGEANLHGLEGCKIW